METALPGAGAAGTVPLCPGQPRWAALGWAGGAGPAGGSARAVPLSPPGAPGAGPGPGWGGGPEQRLCRGFPAGPGPGSPPDPDPSPAPAPAQPSPGSIPGIAVVYPRPEPPGAALGGFPLRGAGARFNAAKMN